MSPQVRIYYLFEREAPGLELELRVAWRLKEHCQTLDIPVTKYCYPKWSPALLRTVRFGMTYLVSAAAEIFPFGSGTEIHAV
jgi:hypothetical protein